jgi:glycosyltransferase involved in cell wall biosynthesis
MPRALVEAMAAGLPSVVSDIPAMTQLVTQGEHGRVVRLGDVPSIGRAIVELFQCPEERAACGRRARMRVVPEHTVEAVAARYVALYEQLLDRMAACGVRGPAARH